MPHCCLVSGLSGAIINSFCCRTAARLATPCCALPGGHITVVKRRLHDDPRLVNWRSDGGPHQCPRRRPGSRQRAGHYDEASPHSKTQRSDLAYGSSHCSHRWRKSTVCRRPRQRHPPISTATLLNDVDGGVSSRRRWRFLSWKGWGLRGNQRGHPQQDPRLCRRP